MVALQWLHDTFRPRLLLLLCATTAPAHAQQSAASGDIIVVTAQRSILGVRPDRTISEDEVAAYGLSSIDELIEEITRERAIGREETVYLIDGQRVTGLGDISGYPTEAINSIQILPRGTAAKLGGSPSQQVVNISLKPQLRSFVGRGSIAVATDGGFSAQNGEISVTDITRPRRINLALRWRGEDALLESERNVQQAPDALSDLGLFRSLRPEISDLELRGSLADQLAPNLNGFITGRIFNGNTQSFLGRDNSGNRLTQRSNLTSGNVDLQLNGEVGNWLLAFIGSYGENHRRTITDNIVTLATQSGSVTQARSRTASAEANATGTLWNLPAGTLSLTLRGRISRDSIATGLDNFTQSNSEVGAGVQIPISSAAGKFSALGDLTAGIEWSHNRISRGGALTNAKYSVQWQPAHWLRVAGSVTRGRTPPSVELTSAPILATPNVRYLDPLQGDTIDVISVAGGNPLLNAQRGNNQRLSIELRPSGSVPFVLTADYSNNRTDNIITALPPGNSLLLLAFPQRFVRDNSGRLITVDMRPLNFARQSDEQVRYGLDFNVPLRSDDVIATIQNGASTDRSVSKTARLRFNLSHTILLKSEVLVTRSLKPVDLLSRDAFGFNGGERPRHEFDVGIEYAARGRGAELSGQHKSQSFINLTGGLVPNTLRFSPLTTFNMRAFMEGQQLSPSAAWLKGTRFSLLVTNTSNARQKVRDQNGVSPLFYQATYRDPTGRLLQFEFRKVF